MPRGWRSLNKIREIAANPRSAINSSFIIVLIFVGILLNIRLNALMYEFSEGQVARQAEIIAENASASFGSVTASLQSRAGALENQDDEIVQTIMGIFNRTQGGMSLGLTAADSAVYSGADLSYAQLKKTAGERRTREGKAGRGGSFPRKERIPCKYVP